MASLLKRLSLRTPTVVSPPQAVTNVQTGANHLLAFPTTTAAPTKAVGTLEKALDDFDFLLFDTPYSPKGAATPKTTATPSATATTLNPNPSSKTDRTPHPTTTTATTAAPLPPVSFTLVNLIVQEDIDLFQPLLLILAHLNFEHRKLVAILFNHFYRHHEVFRDHVLTKTILLDFLVSGYSPGQRAICINCHHILYECIKKDKRLVAWLLQSKHLLAFFQQHCVSDDFEVQSKAFTIFAALFKLYTKTSATHVKNNHEAYFDLYNTVLKQGNYVVQVQFLKLLGDLLVERKWRKVMVLYVNRKENLMVIMKMLKHKSVNIQVEAFHVFKIFVANPEKDDRVEHVFSSNIKKLIKLMKKFLNEKVQQDDELFEERKTVLETLQQIKAEKDMQEEAEVVKEEKEDAVGLVPLPIAPR
jgi:calcium binding protein 39